MARLSIEQRIAQLEARKQALKARLNTQERTRDTRRKVLLGALLLDTLERGRSGQGTADEQAFAVTLEGWVATQLPGFLTRPMDQALFPEYIRASVDQAALANNPGEAENNTDQQPRS